MIDLDWLWLLLGLPITFGLGWVASRFDLQQWHKEQQEAPKAYFRGLNFLLNEQHDKAIDAFTQAIQYDPQTIDLHFALGNLFRRRAEYERAVRVHQHLLQRADLSQFERERAQQALAQDYLTAGLFDRAEQAWLALAGTSFDTESKLALLNLQERSRDWRLAIETAERLEHSGIGSYAGRIAHYWCELAHAAELQNDDIQASLALEQAMQASPLAARPLIMAGHRARAAQDGRLALRLWGKLSLVQASAFNLVAKDYAQTALALQQAPQALEHLQTHYKQRPSLDLLEALGVIDPEHQAQRLLDHIREHHSLSALRSWVLLLPLPTWNVSTLTALDAALCKAVVPVLRYHCAACGFEAHHYFWQCPGCLSWDSFPPFRAEEL